jgi:hypothetical protein
MISIEEQLNRSIEELMKLEPSEIEVELGRRLEETKKEIEQGHFLSAASPMIVPPDATQLAAAPIWLKDLGQAFVRNLSHQMYSLVCDEKDPENVKLRIALASGTQQAALVISGVLVATFGLLPGIATAVAVIVGKRIAVAGHKTVCDAWKGSMKP